MSEDRAPEGGASGPGPWQGPPPIPLRHPHPGTFIICHKHRGSGDREWDQPQTLRPRQMNREMINVSILPDFKKTSKFAEVCSQKLLKPRWGGAYDVMWQVLRCHVEVRGRITARLENYWDNINRGTLRTTECCHQTIKLHLPQVTRWQVVCPVCFVRACLLSPLCHHGSGPSLPPSNIAMDWYQQLLP